MIIVSYKYVKTMPIIKKPLEEFFQSIEEKLYYYATKRDYELHVSPVYEDSSNRWWYQIYIDFDTTNKGVVEKFIRHEIKLKSNFFVEITNHGYHLVSKIAYGPITKDDLARIRKFGIEKLSKVYKGLDAVVSFRHLPAKRCISITRGKRIVPINIPTFLKLSRQEMEKLQIKYAKTTEKTLYKWLHEYVVPKEFLPVKQAPSFILEGLRYE